MTTLFNDPHEFRMLVACTQGHPEFSVLYRRGAANSWMHGEATTPSVIALDCEMVCTASDPMELSRVTVMVPMFYCNTDASFLLLIQ